VAKRNTTDQYIIVEGPAGLQKVLPGLLEKLAQEPAPQPQYVLYLVAEQKSLLKINGNFIGHYDCLGRSVTVQLKEIIVQALREKYGEKGYFADISGKETRDRNSSFLAADGRVVLSDCPGTLAHARKKIDGAAMPASALDHYSLFHKTTQPLLNTPFLPSKGFTK
jgi:hypothetical protein